MWYFNPFICNDPLFHIYPTHFTFRVQGGMFFKYRNHFINCIFVVNIKSCEVFFVLKNPWQTLQLATNCSFDSVNALKLFNCAFMIHKLVKEISSKIALHIMCDPLVHRLYKGYLIWRKVNKKTTPDDNSSSLGSALQLSSNKMHLLPSGMPILWKCSFTEQIKVEKPMLKNLSDHPGNRLSYVSHR